MSTIFDWARRSAVVLVTAAAVMAGSTGVAVAYGDDEISLSEAVGRLGPDICDAFDRIGVSKSSIESVVNAMTDNGFSTDDATTVLAESVKRICPEHKKAIMRVVRANTGSAA